MKPETALDAYKLFHDSPEYLQNPGIDNNLRTTLRIVLQALGFQTEELKREQLDICLGQVLLSQLQQAEELFETSVEALRQAGRNWNDGSLRNYRSALTRFMNWLREQRWYYTPLPREHEDRAPELSVGKGRARMADDKRQKEEVLPFLAWSDLKDVLISPDQLNPEVVTQLEAYVQFWTTPEIGLRKGPPIQPKTMQRSLAAIYFLMGWFNQHQGIDAKDLKLETITAPSDIMVCIDWAVTERQQTYCWASDVIKVAILVARFCNPQAKHYDSRDIPTIKALRFFLGEIRTRREDVGQYSLKFEQFSDDLRKDWAAFERFCLVSEVPERKSSPINAKTFKNYREAVLGILGWQHHVQGVPMEEISLANVADIAVLKESIAYLINSRNVGYGRAANFGYGALSVAKWLNPQSKRRNFADIDQVAEIRDYVGYLRQQHKDQGPRQSLATKRLSFYEAQRVVEYLRQACAPLDKYGDERSPDVIMASWQIYLIVSILTYCPVRQEEIREMTINSTLFREADCYWVKLDRHQHKAGKKSRKGREYPLLKHLTKELDFWLETFRPSILTDHDLVFTRTGSRRNPATRGEPLNEGDMSDLVAGAVHRATAVLFEEPRNTTPHIFRRIAVTFQRRHGRPEQNEAFAEMIGHTVREADATYNEETLREKSQPAEDWWKLKPDANHAPSAPDPVLLKGWVPDDEQELSHLGLSTRQNNYLRKARDRAILVLWALQELEWAELRRLNVGHFNREKEAYSLVVSKLNGDVDRLLQLKPKIGKILQGYIDVRKECKEDISAESPLFIGTGNRSGGGRLFPGSFQRIVLHHLGVA